MFLRVSLTLVPLGLAGAFAAHARAEVLVSCPIDDPTTAVIESATAPATVDCDTYTLAGKETLVTVEAPVCEEPPPTLTYENPDGSSIAPIKVGAVTWTAFDIYRWQCCCGDLSGAGQIVTTDPDVVGGSRGMEADFAAQVVPYLTQTNPSAVGVFDSTSLTGWTRTRDTSRLMLSATLMPAAFGQTGVGIEPLLIELNGDKVGATKFGMAQVTAPMIGAGGNRRTSALNAFANRFLTKNGGLAFVDLGRFTGTGTTHIGSTAYLVEQVRHVSGDGPLTADSIGLQVEVVVRMYTGGMIGH